MIIDEPKFNIFHLHLIVPLLVVLGLGCASQMNPAITDLAGQVKQLQKGLINIQSSGIGWKEIIAVSFGAATIIYVLGHSWTKKKGKND